MVNKTWRFLDSDDRQDEIKNIVRICEIPELTARILVNRGISDVDTIKDFLNPKLKNIMPNPFVFNDMDIATDRIVKAIKNKENVFIFGDYDVDGIVSSYFMVKYLKMLGGDPKYHIPSRFIDGYGVSQNAICSAARDHGTTLFISVDCGTKSIDEVDFANDLGVDVIVIDHHMPDPTGRLPKAVGVVNPNRLDQEDISGVYIKNLCAAGVVFMLLVGLQKKLRDTGFFEDIAEPNLMDFVGCVALGTLCDVMDLVGLNRAFVKLAMKLQNFPDGIRAIMNNANMNRISSADDFSFTIGPVINAAGRVGDPSIAMEMMLSTETSASLLAEQLIKLNSDRKAIEKNILSEAFSIIDANELYKNRFIFVYGTDWNEGIIGIIAGKIKEKFNKPTFVASFNSENNIGRGSARATANADISAMFDTALKKGIITGGGGHKMAGGFSLPKDNISLFYEFLCESLQGENENILNVDCIIPSSLPLLTVNSHISLIEPIGKGVERPILCMKRVRISATRLTKCENHIMIYFAGEFDKRNIKATVFNIKTKEKIYEIIEDNDGQLLDIAFTLKHNERYGLSLIIEDIRFSQ
ncbi:MAG: single-stranded-DNA-specific exonuclease RecJ [Holosporales bacterium]|jgi:single-stranded-DNA-specific exonuclease|nr:single-stranded-DNA-specific exonuclease RecJ [Holosporales bacterium]